MIIYFFIHLHKLQPIMGLLQNATAPIITVFLTFQRSFEAVLIAYKKNSDIITVAK